MGFGKDGKGVLIRERTTITLGGLGVNTAIKQDSPLVITEDFRMIKAKIYAYLTGATFVAGDGPVLVGLSNDDLSVGEIAEALTVDGPLGPDQTVQADQAMRPVFELGMIPFLDEAVNGNQPGLVLPPIEAIVRWTFYNATGWTLFAFNFGSSSLTTGGVIQILAKYFGVWVI